MVLVAIILTVVVLIYTLKSQSKQRKQRAEQITTDAKDANTLAMGMEANVHEVSRYETATDENYTGTTGAVEWQLQTREIFDRIHRRGATVTYSTQWTSSSVRLPNDKFLMIMSTPGLDNSKPQIQKGLFSSLANKLAETAINQHVSGYFGEQYKSLINSDGSIKIFIPELKGFFILTNDEPMSKKFLNDTTVKYITNWMANKPAFSQGWQVNILGILFTPDRSIVSCEALMTNANEVKVFSDFGAGLATLMKEMT